MSTDEPRPIHTDQEPCRGPRACSWQPTRSIGRYGNSNGQKGPTPVVASGPSVNSRWRERQRAWPRIPGHALRGAAACPGCRGRPCRRRAATSGALPHKVSWCPTSSLGVSPKCALRHRDITLKSDVSVKTNGSVSCWQFPPTHSLVKKRAICLVRGSSGAPLGGMFLTPPGGANGPRRRRLHGGTVRVRRPTACPAAGRVRPPATSRPASP
jgi:hypothetical protein